MSALFPNLLDKQIDPTFYYIFFCITKTVKWARQATRLRKKINIIFYSTIPKSEDHLTDEVIHTYYDNIEVNVNKILYGSVE